MFVVIIVFIIVDLNRPRRRLIRVNQDALPELQRTLTQ
jgi:hypothetical protein